MGFRIEVEGGAATEKLLGKLQTSPTGIFPSAFSGYLLFLFTGREKKIIQQFRNEIADLDSLTGETLAFAIFVERLSLRITKVDSDGTGQPSTREFDSAALKDYYSVSGLVKSGKVGWVTKDTELVALTSATNKIATELGVLPSLPCIIVFDGAPNRKFEVVDVTEELISQMVPLLRRTVDRLRKEPDYPEYRNILRKLQANEEAAALNEPKLIHIESQKKAILDMIENSSSVGWERQLRPLIATARRMAGIKGLIGNCFLKYGPLDSEKTRHVEKIMKIIEDTHPQRRRLYSTLEALRKLDNAVWPLDQANQLHLSDIVTRYVEKEFLCDDGRIPQSPDELNALKVALASRLTAVTESILLNMRLDESVHEYGVAVVESLAEREVAQINALREKNSDLDQLSRDLLAEISKLNASFSDIFCDEVRKARISKIVRSSSAGFYKFLRPWMRPQTLLWAEKLFQQM